MDPLSLIKLAAKRVGVVWWFVAVGAVLGVVVIVSRWQVPPQALILGSIGLLVGVVALVVATAVVSLAKPSDPSNKLSLPGLVFLWAFLGIVILSGFLAFSSFFFDVPIPLKSLFFPVTRPVPPKRELLGVTVPVNAGILDEFDPGTAVSDGGKVGFFKIQPRTRAVFSLSESYQWTNDRLDSIEGFLNTCGFVYDLSGFIEQYKSPEVGENDDKFVDLVVWPLFEEMKKKGLTSTRDIGQFKLTKDAITVYVKLDLIPLIKNEKLRLNGTTKAWIDTTSGVFRKPRIQVWKRIIGFDVLNSSYGDSRIFGPYSDPSNLGKAPSQDASSGHPTITSGSGSLVARVIGPNLDGKAVKPNNPSIVSFCNSGDSIDNKSEDPIWVRLGINDNIPEDNGPGFAKVYIEFESLK